MKGETMRGLRFGGLLPAIFSLRKAPCARKTFRKHFTERDAINEDRKYKPVAAVVFFDKMLAQLDDHDCDNDDDEESELIRAGFSNAPAGPARPTTTTTPMFVFRKLLGITATNPKCSPGIQSA